MKNEVVIITSHANSDYKLQTLRECISYIKSSGYKIIISSHIPVNNSIINEVDYFVYDKKNRIINYWEYDKLPAGYFKYLNFDSYGHTIRTEFDHGYSVLRLIRNGLSIANSNGFEKAHIVDYDYLIKEKNFFKEKTSELGKNYDIIGYRCQDYYFVTGLFSVIIKKFLPILESVYSVEKYSSIHLETIANNHVSNTGVLENIFFYLIQKNNIRFLNIKEESIDLKINEFDKINVFNNFYLIENTKIEVFKSTDGNFDYIVLVNCGTQTDEIQIIYKENFSIKIDYDNLFRMVQNENSHIVALKLPDWLLNIDLSIIVPGFGTKLLRKNENKAFCSIKNRKIIFDI